MSHSHEHQGPEAGYENTAADAIFTTEEQHGFWDSDRHAATVIVALLAGIFGFGLIGYLLVCWWVA